MSLSDPTNLNVIFDLVRKEGRGCHSVHILSLTSVSNGYVVIARFNDGPEDWVERVVHILVDECGPKKGECRIGWTHIVNEEYKN
jgi:hypothetical protein